MADIVSPEQRSWNMSRITGKDTKPELRLRSILHRAGYRFRLYVSSLPGRPDIVLPKYHTAIFVNGCFWHRHPGCSKSYTPSSRTEFWTAKFEATIARDAKKSIELRKQGWNVLTVWECELQQSPVAVLDRIATSVAEAA
jgi:DNA mismatch endonuclease (patch repair protein)